MGRLKPLSKDTLSDEQKALLSSIVSGKRGENRTIKSFFLGDGSLRGLFSPWLYAPAIGHPAQQLGEAIRFKLALPPAMRELANLTIATA